jgi:hypothetical protein
MTFKRSLCVALILLTTTLSASLGFAEEKACITNMTVTNIDDSLILYFDVENAFTEKILAALDTGVTISFSFPINIYRVRHLWKDKKVAQIDLINTIKYDTLKKDYLITRPWKSPVSYTVKSLDEAITLMTRIDGLPLSPADFIKGDAYRVRVKARLNKITRPLYLKLVLFFMNSWKLETSWEYIEFIY